MYDLQQFNEFPTTRVRLILAFASAEVLEISNTVGRLNKAL